MRVVMITGYAGPCAVCSPGGVLDVGDIEAATLVEAGAAKYVEPPVQLKPEPPIEAAVKGRPENTAKRTGRLGKK